jgi:RNAse (barnase) inhibitor barstar
MASPEEVEINVSEVESAQQLHQPLYEALHFPDYYGANWDAFWDVMVSENVLPMRLVIHGWEVLEWKLPREAQLMRKCLVGYQEERPDQP